MLLKLEKTHGVSIPRYVETAANRLYGDVARLDRMTRRLCRECKKLGTNALDRKTRKWYNSHLKMMNHVDNSPNTSVYTQLVHYVDTQAADDGACFDLKCSKDRDGYAVVRRNGRTHRAHRLSCQYVYGPAPTGKPMVLHSCHNRWCVNPRHLRWGSHQENMDDLKRKNALRNNLGK